MAQKSYLGMQQYVDTGETIPRCFLLFSEWAILILPMKMQLMQHKFRNFLNESE